jgi:hypothetical protein
MGGKMTSIIFSEDNPISDIMLQVQRKNLEFPVEIKVGPGTFKLQNAEQAKFFSLGVMAYMSAVEERERWVR